MARTTASKILAASASRWSRARYSTYAPRNTGGDTTRNAIRRLKTSARAPTMIGAAAAPNTIDARLNAPKPAPRRWAGTASAIPARSAGIAIVTAKMPSHWSATEHHGGTGRYEIINTVLPTKMQYAGMTTRAPFTLV